MSTTESPSHYNHLEQLSTGELLRLINKEDQTVALSVERALPTITLLADAVLKRMQAGGRLFYIGAGTSGRLGVVDASECPPTYGVSPDLVVGIIAGGDTAIRLGVEFAEDNAEQAWQDLLAHNISPKDCLVGIAASGRTPYVVGGLRQARAAGVLTGCIVCNAGSVVAAEVEYPVEVITGPEFVTGSTRMKAGTAQKMVLNMLTTSVMIGLGKVRGNKMIDMQLTNKKLMQRGALMIAEELKISESEAGQLLQKYGSVRAAIEKYTA